MRVLQCIEWLRDRILEAHLGTEDTEMVGHLSCLDSGPNFDHTTPILATPLATLPNPTIPLLPREEKKVRGERMVSHASRLHGCTSSKCALETDQPLDFACRMMT